MNEVSLPLKRLRRRINKFVSHPLSLRKDNILYLNFNKKYKKFDWSKDYYSKQEVVEIVDDSKFRNLESIIKNSNHFDNFKIDNITYITRESLEEEFLKREMCSYMEDKMWKRSINKKKKIKCKTGPTKEYFLRGLGKKFYMGKLPTKMIKKIKLIKEFLLNNKSIFDKKSKNYLSPKQIRYLISRKMLYGNIDKFELFLSQSLENKNKPS